MEAHVISPNGDYTGTSTKTQITEVVQGTWGRWLHGLVSTPATV